MAKVRAAGDEIDDESEAARLHGAVKAYNHIAQLYLFLRCWDTAFEEAHAALRDLVATEMIPLCGGKPPVAAALANALPAMFYALSIPGMPFDSVDIGQVFSEHLRPYRNAHVRVQSVWGMTVAEDLLTFDGMCEKNGIDPCDGLDRLTACPEWFAADDYGGGGCACGSAAAPDSPPPRPRGPAVARMPAARDGRRPAAPRGPRTATNLPVSAPPPPSGTCGCILRLYPAAVSCGADAGTYGRTASSARCRMALRRRVSPRLECAPSNLFTSTLHINNKGVAALHGHQRGCSR